MSYSTGLALAPKITISDYNDNLLYAYESSQVVPVSPRQDFFPETGEGHVGVNDDHGYFSFMFEDVDKNFINNTAKADSKIPQQSNVQLYLGRTPALLNRWFNGKVFRTHMIRSETNVLYQFVFCLGWGIRTTERVAQLRRFQDKLVDGVTVDATDGKTSGTELYKSLFRDTDHYIYRSLPKETEIEAAGFSEVAQLQINFADIQDVFQTWTHIQSRLAGGMGAYFGIDQDRKTYLRFPNVSDSGFLITNDTQSLLTQNWNQNKLGYLQEKFGWYESTERSGYNLLHAYGAAKDELDINQAAANAAFDMSTFWIANPLIPNQEVLQKIALKVRKRGTPQDDILIRIVGATAQASGSPKITDQKKAITITKERLQQLDSVFSSYLEIPFEWIKLQPQDLYFVVVPKYGSVANTILFDYNTGAVANSYYDSSNGTSWTTRTGGQVPAFVMRTYPTRAVNLSLFASRSYRQNGNKVRERAIPLRDLQSVDSARSMLIGLAPLYTKPRRVYTDLKVTAPDLPPPVAKYVRLIDNFTGLDQNVNLIGYDFTMDAHESDNLGVRELKLNFEAFE